MKLVIDISEDDYRKVQDGRASVNMMRKTIRNGTPLPKDNDVLDKIRAEINSPNRGTCDYFIVDRIEEIINEYKAESEEGADNERHEDNS